MHLSKRVLLVTLMLMPLACSAQQAVDVREVATLKETYPPGGLEFSADGALVIAIAGSYPHDGHVWSWREAKVVASLAQAYTGADRKRPSRSSRDGQYWAMCGHGVTIWSAHAWQPIVTLPGNLAEEGTGKTTPVNCQAIVFSADGKQMIVAQNDARSEPRIVAYDTASWQRAWSLSTSPFNPENLAISPDGRLLAMSGSSSAQTPGAALTSGFDIKSFSQSHIAVVDLKTQSITRTIAVDDTDYTSSRDIAWGRDGKTITIAANAALRTYDLSNGSQDVPVLAENKFARPRLFTSPDGRYQISTDFGERHDLVRVVDISGASRKIIHEIHARPMNVAWAPDSKHFALSGAARSLASVIPFGDLLVQSAGKIVVYEIR